MERCDKKRIREVIKEVELSHDISVLLSQMIRLSRKTDILIDSFLLNCLIIASQIQKYFNKYYYLPKKKNLVRDYYQKTLPHMYSYCKSYKIFNEYKNHLETEYSNFMEIENNTCSSKSNNFNGIDLQTLRNLAIR